MSQRQVFEGPCYFANDALCCGVHDDRIFIRLPEEERVRLLAEWPETKQFEPLPGRVMREYLVIPPSLAGAPDELREWLTRSEVYAASLPPREKKRRTTKK